MVKVTGGSNKRVSLAALIAVKPGCRLPPYAHELKPVEVVWSQLKRSLANLPKRNIG